MILGRLCMEADILAESIALPASLQAGDMIVIGDTGAYDSSMTYDFGKGRNVAHERAPFQ